MMKKMEAKVDNRIERRERMRIRIVQLGILLIMILVLSMPLLVVAQIDPDRSEEYSQSFVFHGLADSNDYFHISKFEWDQDATVGLTAYTDDHVIYMTAKNIETIQVDVEALWIDFSEVIQEILEEKNYDVKLKDDAFTLWAQKMTIDVHSDPPVNRVVLRNFPVEPKQVKIDNVFWTEGTGYQYEGETLSMRTPIDKDHYQVSVSFSSAMGEEEGITVEDLFKPDSNVEALTSIGKGKSFENTVSTTVFVGAVVAGTAAVGSTLAGAGASAAGGVLNIIFGRMRDFFLEVGEESLREKTAVGLEGGRPTFITKEEVFALIFSITALVLASAYVEMIGEPSGFYLWNERLFARDHYSWHGFYSSIPYAFATITLVIIAMEIAAEICARFQGIWSEFRVWPIGALTLIMSSVIFLMPFAYPGRSTYRSNIELPTRIKAYVALAKLLAILMFIFPFVLLHVQGFPRIAEIGLTISLMIYSYALFPFKPLEGVEIYEWNKKVWAIMFFTGIFLFFGYQLSVLEWHIAVAITYLVVGAAAGIVLVQLMFHLYLNRSEYTVEELQAIYEEYNLEEKEKRKAEEEKKKGGFMDRLKAKMGRRKSKAVVATAGRSKCPECGTVVQRDWLICPVCDNKLHRRR